MPFIGGIKAYVIAIAAAALIATVTVYVIGSEKAKGQRDVLEAQKTNLLADIAARDLTITELRTSRDTVNTRLAELIAGNNKTIAAEVERRRLIALDRDKAKAALNIALDTIATESDRDESFAAWLPQSVPGAAWDRLRSTAE